jgi:hypothetical protein
MVLVRSGAKSEADMVTKLSGRGVCPWPTHNSQISR